MGWFLILVPTLAVCGPLLGVGHVTAFRAAAVVLFATAAWDWWRFHDRSRTFYVAAGLAGAFLLAGLVAMGWSRPPTGPAVDELVSVMVMFALGLAFVQLYRSGETVLTVARGWLYALWLVVAEAVIEIVSGQRLAPELPGPYVAGFFSSPEQLAAACAAGVLVMPVGFALEYDRRLRWAFVAVCPVALLVVLHTGSTLGPLVCGAVLAVWAALHRWGRLVALPLGVVGLAALPSGRAFAVNLWAELAGLLGSRPVGTSVEDRLNLFLDGVVMLRRSLWLGVGPGGFPHVMTSHLLPYGTHGTVEPYSAALEIASQYGLSIFVATTLLVIGAIRWSLQRLLRTRGEPLMAARRAPAFWLLVTLLVWPVVSALNGTWLGEPMSALHGATVVLLCRHIERPKGRLVLPSEAALRHLRPGPDTSGEAPRPGGPTD